MTPQVARHQKGEGGPITLLPANILMDRMREIHEWITRRAYEIFEGRGRVPGRELDDWLQAESEILAASGPDLRESPEAIVLRAELPGGFKADEIEIGVEPRRLMISAEKRMSKIAGGRSKTRTETRQQRILRVQDLPVEVDPSKSTAALRGQILEIVMPKAAPAGKGIHERHAAASGR